MSNGDDDGDDDDDDNGDDDDDDDGDDDNDEKWILIRALISVRRSINVTIGSYWGQSISAINWKSN